MATRILIVDDDPFARGFLEKALARDGTEVVLAGSAAEALARFAERDFNLVVLDQRLPDGSGIECFRALRARRPHQVALLVTAFADIRDAVAAVREGMLDYLTKPFADVEQLERAVAHALELDRAYREISELRGRLAAGDPEGGLIGRSPALEQVVAQIRQVGPLDTTVLLEGASGTGKELAARLIHQLSPRGRGPFVGVNCGALSESLLESTLFGFEKGAFTGAQRATAGCFEQADGGTLFLDEIADMSPKLQSSLLRVIQERRFARLGSAAERSSDFRLICASNRLLRDESRAGRFRDDLYYRIAVVVLTMPPLRERRDDIALLAAHFLDLFNRRFGKDVGPFSPAAVAELERREWPGNVRELQNVIERCVALKTGGLIKVGDLAPPHPAGDGTAATTLVYREARDAFERGYLERLLAAAKGNVSEAARLSGINRQNLYVRMKRFGIVAD